MENFDPPANQSPAESIGLTNHKISKLRFSTADSFSAMKPSVSTVSIGILSLASFHHPCHASATNSTGASITLVPAVRPMSIAWHDKNTSMLFQVVSDDNDVICIMGDASYKKICGGYFTLDLQHNKELQVTFEAPSGYELQMGALVDEGINFEFQARNENMDFDCDTIGSLVDAPYDIEPRMIFDTTSALQSLRTEKRFSTPTLVGSGIDALSLDKTRSFARVSTCEIYFKMVFTGLSQNATIRLTEMSFTVPYETDSMMQGKQSFHYQSSGPMGIKASKPLLVQNADKGLSSNSTKPAEGTNSTNSVETKSESSSVEEATVSALRGSDTQSALAASSTSSIRLVVTAFAIAVGATSSFFM